MNKSETINELAAALCKAQAAMGAAAKDASNPFFKSKYADMASVVEAVKGPLTANGLAYVQLAGTTDAGEATVETILMHTSGQWIGETLKMKPVKGDPQGMGSALTYARRYGLQSICGIPAEDDDGNAASEAGRGKAAQPARPAAKVEQPAAAPNAVEAAFDDALVSAYEKSLAACTKADDCVPIWESAKGEADEGKLSAAGLDIVKRLYAERYKKLLPKKGSAK